MARFLKHETQKVDAQHDTKNKVSFFIPDHLSEKEKEILLELKNHIQKGLAEWEINQIEKIALVFIEKVENTKLSPLKDWFKLLKTEASLFNLSNIKLLLEDALSKIEKV